MLNKLKVLFAFFLLLAIFAGCQDDFDPIAGPDGTEDTPILSKGGHDASAVYTLSNSAAGNEVIVFNRSRRGHLSPAGIYSTGGLGTGSGLGSQGAVVLSGKFLFAVNAGSDEVSVLKVSRNGLTLVDKVSSGGTMPISLTVHRHLLYVLNAGGDGNITGFSISRNGELTPIPGSTQPLSGSGVGPAQVEFNPRGRVLVVTEKGTNLINTYVVGSDGVAGPPNTQASAGDTPFGFEFDKRGHLIVSDAFGGGPGLGAMSSYNVSAGGISLITGPVANTQTASCWVVVTKNGKFTYTSNTGTNNISGYKIRHNGSLELFDDGGNTASTGAGSSPIDMAVSNNSKYLYCLNAGNETISVFKIDNRHGGLSSVQTVSGLPDGSVGLAAN
jgi:6-phosphogluconolactonase (cycloisomerase 2 family)